MTFKRSALAFALSPLWAISVTSAQPATLASEPSAAAVTALSPTQAHPAAQISASTTLAIAPLTTTEPAAAVNITPANAPAPTGVLEAITQDANATKDALKNESEVIVVSEPIIAAPPTDLWDRMRPGFAMRDLDDEYVRKWEQFYAGKPDYMQRVVERGGKYMFYIVTEIERRGMPLEIALLPIVESAFVAQAKSTAAAAGIWQFIPSTGKHFGMKQDWWADSRRDIVQATKGALDYLEKLHGMFGDWHLALASYNWGEGAVGRAVAANQAAGRGTDYASLNMPNETRNYIPKLQAIKNIVLNPGAFNLKLAGIPNQPYFKTVTLSHHIDVDKAIKMADVSKEEFLALNPAHNRPVIGGRDEHQILLPANNADLFLSRLGAGEKVLVSWMAYKTKAGDRLEAVAQRFGTTVDTLRAVNGIRSAPPALPAGYNLLVPSAGPSEEALGSLQNAVFTKLPEYAPGPALPKIHRVASGDTIASVAKRYGVTATKLAQWNRVGAKAKLGKGTLLAVSGAMPMQTKLVRVKKGGRYVMVKQSVPAVRVVSGKRGNGKIVYAKAGGKKAKAKRNTRRRA